MALTAFANLSGKLTKIIGERINQRNIKEIFEKLNTGGITIEKANGMSEEKLHELGILALYTRVTNMQSGNRSGAQIQLNQTLLWNGQNRDQAGRYTAHFYRIICIFCEHRKDAATNTFCTFLSVGHFEV